MSGSSVKYICMQTGLHGYHSILQCLLVLYGRMS